MPTGLIKINANPRTLAWNFTYVPLAGGDFSIRSGRAVWEGMSGAFWNYSVCDDRQGQRTKV